MKTKSSLSQRRQELKARHRLSDRQFDDMLAMLSELTPAERATLKDADFITEDEADLIVCDRRADEPAFSSEEVLAEIGYTRRKRSA